MRSVLKGARNNEWNKTKARIFSMEVKIVETDFRFN
jgi:hypothetical protein